MPETPTNPTGGRKACSRPPSTTADKQSVRNLHALEELATGQLRAEWQRLYRSPAPRLSRDLLIRGIAYRLQEAAFGGMSKATHRKLAAFARELEANGRLTTPSTPQLKPGARLVREWQGRTYSVAVLDQGFEYEGEVYGSLTKIAQVITGAHWSGPRFFGLVDRLPSQEEPDRAVDASSAGDSHG